MNQRTLGILIFVVIALVAIYSATTPETMRVAPGEEARLLAAVDGDEVARVRIEQGEQSVELRVNKGNWSVPARGGYRADGSKVRSLLLKLFDLTVSQKLPATDASFDKLGVSDEAVKRGQSRITFFNAADRELGGVRIGEARKTKPGSDAKSAASGGQYVRSLSGKEVYLVALPLQFSVTPSYWLDQNVINVLPAHLRSVEMFTSADGSSKQEYVLKRVGEAVPGTTPTFELVNATVPAGKSVQDVAVSQVRSGLENVRLQDVFPKDSPEVKDLQFDATAVYRLESGLIYTVESAERKDKEPRFFARISAQFDPAVGAEVEAFNKSVEEELAKKAAETKPSDSKPVESKTDAAEKPAPQKKPLSSEKEAEQQRAQFAGWVFELPPYQSVKLRQRFDNLVQAPDPASEQPPQAMPNEIMELPKEAAE